MGTIRIPLRRSPTLGLLAGGPGHADGQHLRESLMEGLGGLGGLG